MFLNISGSSSITSILFINRFLCFGCAGGWELRWTRRVARLSGFKNGQTQGHTRAASFLAFNSDLSLMERHATAHDRESHAGATDIPYVRRAVEGCEKLSLIGLGNPQALVRDLNDRMVSMSMETHVNGAAWRGILHCVRKQIAQHVTQETFIA